MVIYQRSRRTNLADIAIVVFVSALAFLGEFAFATQLPSPVQQQPWS